MKSILTILAIALFGLTGQKATACSCIGESTVEGGYKNADMVTTGKIITVETKWLPDSARMKRMVELGFPADSLDKRLIGYYLKKALVKVDKVYKGDSIPDTLTIYTGMGGGDCGFQFNEGQKYIIYGDTNSYFGGFFRDQKILSGRDVYWTNICTRTQVHNGKEIRELERLNK